MFLKVIQTILIGCMLAAPAWGQLAIEPIDADTLLLREEGLKQLVEKSPVFGRCFSGFALYDPIQQAMIYENDADKCYIPASNTKILTFYTAYNILGDSIPALRYLVMGDTLIFWGTGNPTFLNPNLPADSTVLTFLKNRPEKLFFSTHNFEDERYAPGWSWDNYNYDFQPERSSFPIYGNVAIFRRNGVRAGFDAYPAYFADHTAYNSHLKSSYPYIRRRIDSNLFEYNNRALSGVPFQRTVPFRSSPDLVVSLLSDTLHRPVQLIDLEYVPVRPVYTLSVPLADTVYKKLLQDSDNFIAEQLLMACSEKLFGAINSKQAIQYARDQIFKGLVNDLMWEDGSGLSRYNLFTPETITKVLSELYKEIPAERLLNLFATGGVSGTIKDWYGDKERPYVFAKTGSLNGVHCLSGFVLTKTSKVLIFSFMHNNFTFGSNALKVEMERVLRYVAEHY